MTEKCKSLVTYVIADIFKGLNLIILLINLFQLNIIVICLNGLSVANESF